MRPTVPHPKAIRGVLCPFHYGKQEFMDINNDPFPIPLSLDNLMEEVTGTSVKRAIYSDPEQHMTMQSNLVSDSKKARKPS